MARNEMGWLGWFCVAGVVILAGLYVLVMAEPELWEFSMMWTGIVALLAGFWAIAPWFGDDPTAPTKRTSEPPDGRSLAQQDEDSNGRWRKPSPNQCVDVETRFLDEWEMSPGTLTTDLIRGGVPCWPGNPRAGRVR